MGDPGPKAYIEGPMYVTEDGTWTSDLDAVPIYSGQESRTEANADLNIKAIPFMGSTDTFITGFFAGEDISFSGLVTHNRLWPEREGKTYNIPYTGDTTINSRDEALADYIVELESLCVQNPGAGYKLRDEMRGRTGSNAIDPTTDTEGGASETLGNGFIIESIDWEYEEAAPHQISYTIQGFKSEGVTGDPSSRNSFIRAQWRNIADTNFYPIDEIKLSRKNTLDEKEDTNYNRYILGNIINKRMELSIGIEKFNIAFGGSENTLSIPTEGVQRKISVEGAITERDFDQHQSELVPEGESALEEFAMDISNNWVGNNLDMVYGDSTTNRGFNGQLSQFSTTFEAGSPSRMLYSLEFVVGNTDGQAEEPSTS